MDTISHPKFYYSHRSFCNNHILSCLAANAGKNMADRKGSRFRIPRE